VQKDASLKRIAMQVEYHSQIESRMPKSWLQKLHKKEVIKYPTGWTDQQAKITVTFAYLFNDFIDHASLIVFRFLIKYDELSVLIRQLETNDLSAI